MEEHQTQCVKLQSQPLVHSGVMLWGTNKECYPFAEMLSCAMAPMLPTQCHTALLTWSVLGNSGAQLETIYRQVCLRQEHSVVETAILSKPLFYRVRIQQPLCCLQQPQLSANIQLLQDRPPSTADLQGKEQRSLLWKAWAGLQKQLQAQEKLYICDKQVFVEWGSPEKHP